MTTRTDGEAEAGFAALDEVLRRLEARPGVVLFDLDSTLVDTSFRHLAILRAFAAEQGAHWPGLEEAVAGLTAADLGYSVDDALRDRGIEDPALLEASVAFWHPRFFSNRHLDVDRLYPGALDCVRACRERGATICYVTARSERTMGSGTRRSLRRLRLPLEGPEVHLMLRPRGSMTDRAWKAQAMAAVDALGPVVATFDNEPGHCNLFLGRWPGALHFWLRTCWSPTAPEPAPGVIALDGFGGWSVPAYSPSGATSSPSSRTRRR